MKSKAFPALGLLIVAGGAVMWFYQYNQAPAKGVVHSTVTEPDQASARTTTHFNGVAIAFDYPSDYTSVENKTTALSPPTTELYSLNKSSPTTGSNRIGITIKDLSGGPMLEDSAYKFRSIKAKGYVASDVALPRYTAKKTQKPDGSEITYFIQGQKAYAIIAATSTRPGGDFEKEVTELVGSFVWR